MPSLFEPAVAEAIVARLQKISADTPRLWGKMTAAQMMAHCSAGFAFYFSGKRMKQNLLGMLLGKGPQRTGDRKALA